MAEEQKKKSNRPAQWDRPDKGGKKVIKIVQPGDPAPVPRRGVYRGAPKSTPPLEPVVEPSQKELNYMWATMSPTEDLNEIKRGVDKLVKGGKIRAEAAPMALSYAVYAREEILGLEKGESRSALKKFVNENYFFDSGTRAPGTREEQAIVDFARGRENTKQGAIGKVRGPLEEENRAKLLKSMSGKSGRDFINATLNQAIESGAMPDDSGKRPEIVERILSVNPPETPIQPSTEPLKRRVRGRTRIVVGSPQDPEQSAEFRMELAASGGKVPDVEFSRTLSDKEEALRVGSKAYTSSSKDNKEEEKVKVLKRFPDGNVLSTKIQKAAELWDKSTVGGSSTKWEGSEAETFWARSMGLDPDSLKYDFDKDGTRYLVGSKTVETTKTAKAEAALAFNLIKNQLFGEQKAAEDDKGERKVIMKKGEPVLDKSGKPKTYPQRTALQKAQSRASNEEQALGQGPDAIVREAIEAQEPEQFNPKQERKRIREELVAEFPELLQPSRKKELKRRVMEKFDLVERTKSGESLEPIPEPAAVPGKIEGRSREPLKVSEEPTGKKFKVKSKAGLSPRILAEPTDLPEGRAAEPEPTHLRVLRKSDIARRVRVSDAPPAAPMPRRDRYGQAKILTAADVARKEQERLASEQQKKVARRKFLQTKPFRYLMGLLRKGRL